jgi:hypothetical protein
MSDVGSALQRSGPGGGALVPNGFRMTREVLCMSVNVEFRMSGGIFRTSEEIVGPEDIKGKLKL